MLASCSVPDVPPARDCVPLIYVNLLGRCGDDLGGYDRRIFARLGEGEQSQRRCRCSRKRSPGPSRPRCRGQRHERAAGRCWRVFQSKRATGRSLNASPAAPGLRHPPARSASISSSRSVVGLSTGGNIPKIRNSCRPRSRPCSRPRNRPRRHGPRSHGRHGPRSHGSHGPRSHGSHRMRGLAARPCQQFPYRRDGKWRG